MVSNPYLALGENVETNCFFLLESALETGLFRSTARSSSIDEPLDVSSSHET